MQFMSQLQRSTLQLPFLGSQIDPLSSCKQETDSLDFPVRECSLMLEQKLSGKVGSKSAAQGGTAVGPPKTEVNLSSTQAAVKF